MIVYLIFTVYLKNNLNLYSETDLNYSKNTFRHFGMDLKSSCDMIRMLGCGILRIFRVVSLRSPIRTLLVFLNADPGDRPLRILRTIERSVRDTSRQSFFTLVTTSICCHTIKKISL